MPSFGRDILYPARRLFSVGMYSRGSVSRFTNMVVYKEIRMIPEICAELEKLKDRIIESGGHL